MDNSEFGLSFDDILLIPKYSDLESRKDPNIGVKLGSSKYNIRLGMPIISSPMDSITGPKMLNAMTAMGGLGILSRQISLDSKEELAEQIKVINRMTGGRNDYNVVNLGCAIGIKNALEHTMKLVDAACSVICLDVAHCDHAMAHKALTDIYTYRSKSNNNFVIMAGNICTKEAAKILIDIGVDVIKVGIGSGAICSTRNVTGFGVPQLTAIQQCYRAVRESCDKDVSIVGDGGIRSTGDMVKCLWAGADACMVGYMLAGTDCTPDIDGKKMYRGMSSHEVSKRDDIAPEGVSVDILNQGKTATKLNDFILGIKSGFAMGGARTIGHLRNNVEAIRVTPIALKESNTL